MGLHVERSIDWVMAVLAILKANAAVVPLPLSDPAQRLLETLAYGRLDAVLDHADTPLPPSAARRVFRLADLATDSDTHGSVGPGRPDQAAFVLRSSGSTGRPKMIVRSHRSFFHRLNWTWGQHPFASDEIGCQKAHMTTTHVIYELFEPLLHGVPTVIVPDREARNLEQFWDNVRARGVSRLLVVPSTMRATLDMPGFRAPQLKVLVLMGEYLHPQLAERVVRAFPEQTLPYSIYGSTEASSTLLCDLLESLRSGEELPLGSPISPEVQTLVLASDMKPVVPGEVGRLYYSRFTPVHRILERPHPDGFCPPPSSGARRSSLRHA